MIKLIYLLFNGGKILKVLLSCGSMIMMIFLYGLIFGWVYAVGIVMLILIHELGHYIAGKIRGYEMSLPFFIPFLGAFVAIKEQPRNIETDAFISMGGPLLGAFSGFFCLQFSLYYNIPVMTALAYTAFLLNFFQLLPIGFLDGGKIISILSPRLWWIGCPILISFFYFFPSPVLILVGISSLQHLILSFKSNEEITQILGYDEDYFKISQQTRFQYALLYLMLLLYCGIMAFKVKQDYLSHYN
jgi:Zn-dependent protease